MKFPIRVYASTGFCGLISAQKGCYYVTSCAGQIRFIQVTKLHNNNAPKITETDPSERDSHFFDTYEGISAFRAVKLGILLANEFQKLLYLRVLRKIIIPKQISRSAFLLSKKTSLNQQIKY